ncbi:MAG: hypothetical protein ACC608_04810 [Anaerofustis sp.]
MDWESIVTIISIIGGICGVYFGFRNSKRQSDTETKEEGKQSATLFSDIGYIKSGIDDLKRKQEKSEDRYIALTSRVTAVEESAKQAHKRIDCIEQK